MYPGRGTARHSRRRRRRRWMAACAMVAAPALLAAAGTAAAATQPNITTRGVQFVDQRGRVVVLRGVNISDRSAHMRDVAAIGANFVRLRVLWAQVEPARGRFDAAELARLDTFVGYFTTHGIAVELDLRGRRVPDWFGSTRRFYGRNAPASQRAYLGFVRTIVARYDTNPFVMGYGIFNEPQPYHWSGFGSPRVDQRILSWQARIRDGILAVDPYRAVFLNIRGGNYGVASACFRCAGFGLAHTVLDWHDYYNGCCGSGMDATADNWLPSWPETHNQRNHAYRGSISDQWLNLAIPWSRTRRLGVPMIVGEWGVRIDDAGRGIYDDQMWRILTRHGLSWARWDMDNGELGLVRHGALNDQGAWLRDHLVTG